MIIPSVITGRGAEMLAYVPVVGVLAICLSAQSAATLLLDLTWWTTASCYIGKCFSFDYIIIFYCKKNFFFNYIIRILIKNGDIASDMDFKIKMADIQLKIGNSAI